MSEFFLFHNSVSSSICFHFVLWLRGIEVLENKKLQRAVKRPKLFPQKWHLVFILVYNKWPMLPNITKIYYWNIYRVKMSFHALLRQALMEMPPVTRAYTTSCVLITICVQLELLSPFQLYFNPILIWKNLQVSYAGQAIRTNMLSIYSLTAKFVIKIH